MRGTVHWGRAPRVHPLPPTLRYRKNVADRDETALEFGRTASEAPEMAFPGTDGALPESDAVEGVAGDEKPLVGHAAVETGPSGLWTASLI